MRNGGRSKLRMLPTVPFPSLTLECIQDGSSGQLPRRVEHAGRANVGEKCYCVTCAKTAFTSGASINLYCEFQRKSGSASFIKVIASPHLDTVGEEYSLLEPS